MASTQKNPKKEPQGTKKEPRKLANPPRAAGYPKPGLSRKHFDIDAGTSRQLRVYAATHDLTMRDVVNLALDEFFARHAD